ncbi:DUF418 domain-containing protein [Pseudalkalibacillus caeni]|uniref:DUF418 domain-containing protein n=1 Tax=Exobacillus caeni TaxID=2574798 RepID=UPI001484FD73|nr:DUF418 domain-containing protein [Pseudalkalibacillus caeni]
MIRRDGLVPTTEKERIESIDVMRGLALLGIFFVNMLDFHSPWLYIDEDMWWETTTDKVTVFFIDVFAQASFYPLFSFLFGFGMILFFEKARQKEVAFWPVALRRLLALLVFGIVHAFLIWHGDILITYAAAGTLLILFLRVREKVLFYLAMGLWLIPSFLLTGLLVMNDVYTQGDGNYQQESEIKQSIQVYGSGSYADITIQRIHDWLYVNGGFYFFFIILSIFPLFLFGAYFAKKKIIHYQYRDRNALKAVLIWSIAIGLPIKLSPYLLSGSGVEFLQDSIGGPLLALSYIVAVVLLEDAGRMKRVFSGLKKVGRMSLTNYLFQSIISTFIFYSYGIGLYGKISSLTGCLFVVVIFSIQILYSTFWLKSFSQGPMEWVWRTITYLNVQPLKRRKTSS